MMMSCTSDDHEQQQQHQQHHEEEHIGGVGSAGVELSTVVPVVLPSAVGVAGAAASQQPPHHHYDDAGDSGDGRRRRRMIIGDDDDIDDDTVTGNWSMDEDDDDDDDDTTTRERKQRRRITASANKKMKKKKSSGGGGSSGSGNHNSRNGGTTTGGGGHGRGRGGGTTTSVLSSIDIEIFQRLDREYDYALEERDVSYMARYTSVRQSAIFSVGFMLCYFTLATIFYMRQTDWTLSETLLFLVYTITSVGYGHLDNPRTSSFQWYTITFILIGIATLTIMVAQVYQWLALETARAQYDRDNTYLRRRGGSSGTNNNGGGAYSNNNSAHSSGGGSSSSSSNTHAQQQQQQHRLHSTIPGANSAPTNSTTGYAVSIGEMNGGSNNNNNNAGSGIHHRPLRYYHPGSSGWWYNRFENCIHCIIQFFIENEYGRAISIVFPLVGLVMIGALFMAPLEGWTMTQSIYFSVVSLTTVGFGDYYPTNPLTIYFCLLWLPTSVGFMSYYLSYIATFYIQLSNTNIERIEYKLRKRILRMKQQAEYDREQIRRRALRGQQVSIIATQQQQIQQQQNQQQYDHSDRRRRPPPSAASGSLSSSSRFSGVAREEDDDDVENNVVRHHHDVSNRGRSTTTTRRRLFGTSGSAIDRRERILQNHATMFTLSSQGDGTATYDDDDENENENQQQQQQQLNMATMKDVLRAVHANNDNAEYIRNQNGICNNYNDNDYGNNNTTSTAGANSNSSSNNNNNNIFSIRSSSIMKDPYHTNITKRKPSFALRAIVQERFATIIAMEIAGNASNIDIKDDTLSITIDILRYIADKWIIPRRARKAFRAVTFESIYFVGEHRLITVGVNALLELTPFEFHGLFSPLLAALGDAETMESWLTATQTLIISLNNNVDQHHTNTTHTNITPKMNHKNHSSHNNNQQQQRRKRTTKSRSGDGGGGGDDYNDDDDEERPTPVFA